jgi:FtsP/CotA-like multicopper oxidase with cupredoxin domain
MKKLFAITRLLTPAITAVVLLASAAFGAAPGVQGKTFTIAASPSYITQPDGSMVYSWGYSCDGGGTAMPFPPATGSACAGIMQIPGPTLIVNEGDVVTVTLNNKLPAPAGTTSILFPGFTVSSTGGVPGLLTQEAAPSGSVTYSFPTLGKTGTHAYYSGTRGDVQIEMGLYGTIIVVPTTVPSGCRAVSGTLPDGQQDYRLAAAA